MNFDKIFPLLLEEEGGWVNNPDDPGGETNLGITWPVLREAIDLKHVPPDTTIKNLLPDQAKVIYFEFYWKPIKGEQLPLPLGWYVFSSAVNQGVVPATKMLQRALNLPQDGIFGVATLQAAIKSRIWHANRFMAFRAMRYTSTRNFDKFGEGWLIRTFSEVTKGAKL